MAEVYTDIQAVGGGANYDIRPPLGQNWLLSEIGSSVWAGVAPNGVPTVNAGLFDGVTGPSWFVRSTDVRGWRKGRQIYIDNTNFVRINNPGAAANISFVLLLVLNYGTVGVTAVMSDVQSIGAGATVNIRPTAGQEWLVTDFGSDRWVGGAPAGLPDLTVEIFNGAINAMICQGANARGWEKTFEIYVDNTNYLRLTNTNGLVAAVSWSAVMSINRGSIGTTSVITALATVGIGGVMTVRPTGAQEFKVTEIGASVWGGVAPAQLPNCSVALTDGTIASVVARGTDNKGWLDSMGFFINNGNWMTITDTGGAGGNLGISGIRTRAI